MPNPTEPRPRRVLGGVCKNNHRLTPDNAYRAANGSVRCRACHREWQRRRRGSQPRHYNRIGGTCQRGHPLTHETVYLRTGGGYQCAACNNRARKARQPRPAPPAEKRCERCRVTKPIAAFDTPRTRWCRRCHDEATNAKRCAAAKRETVSRRAEVRSIVAYCRTGTDRLVAERGWSSCRVATALGVPRWSFRHWLLGERMPRFGRVADLAEAMGALLAREGLL